MVIAVVLIPVTNLLGGDQQAWLKFSFVMAVLAGLCLFATYKTSKETNSVTEAVREPEEEDEIIPLSQAANNLFHNKYWVMILVMGLCANVTYGLANSSGTYYAKWIYGNDNLIGIQGMVGNIENHKNHLATGFVGTPYICHVLSEHGAHETAGTLLMKEDYPSWLYAVNQGATTIWERWDSIRPDGSFDESGMNSLNHYVYGSIGDWLYRKVAGISQLELEDREN